MSPTVVSVVITLLLTIASGLAASVVVVLAGLTLVFGVSVFGCWLLAQVPIVTYLRYHALCVLGDILNNRQPAMEPPTEP